MNLAIGPPGLRYKESAMPFVQMENISHFLRACQSPPISMPPHDVFLTVDLYEAKDPAQVLQCLGAFSRRASIVQPARFPRAIGKGKTGVMTPQSTGRSNGGYSAGAKATYERSRGTSDASESSTSTFNPSTGPPGGRVSPTKDGGTKSPTGGVSSWSKRTDEGATTPAWNIAQYGYMGGASQGNMGITFGGRRQITTPGPKVPNLAEKERRRREEEAEAERLRLLAEEAENKRRTEREAAEERDRIAEGRRWAEETRVQKEKQKAAAAEEKRRWEEEERRWKEEEAKERELEARLEKEGQSARAKSEVRLQGQFLSQYQADQQRSPKPPQTDDPARLAECERVRDLERQLEEAKKREAEYERERLERLPPAPTANPEPKRPQALEKHQPPRADEAPSHPPPEEDSWQADEREYLRRAWRDSTTDTHPPPPQPPRPLPTPTPQADPPSTPTAPPPSYDTRPALPSRPLPNPTTYTPPPSSLPSRQPDNAPLASPQKPTPGGWASKSLLEREMERERQRQREWEDSQHATKALVQQGVKEGGSGPGESWDVNQYGYVGGDSQNRGGPGLGGRRQILGPRPRPA